MLFSTLLHGLKNGLKGTVVNRVGHRYSGVFEEYMSHTLR